MTNLTTPEYEHLVEVLKDFVSAELCIDKATLTTETRIETDVWLSGLDTYTFYETYFSAFGISNRSDFQVDEYVTSEVSLRHLLKGIFSKNERQKLFPKETTLGHLAQVAMTKKWVNP